MTETTCNGCSSSGTCPSAQSQKSDRQPPPPPAPEADRKLQDRLSGIKRKILVLSGKGGVGKSTVAANLAISLELAGKKVGLLDIDIHGPSIPKLMSMEGQRLAATDDGIAPVEMGGMKVMSIGFLLQNPDDALIWRGPMKYGVIKQFLSDVDWGELDYLIVDAPPGTGDEPLSIAQLLGHVDGAVIVTTPQELAVSDVRKCIKFCRQVEVPVTGVLENMSGFTCPHCGGKVDIFKRGGGKHMAEELGVPFLGAVPVDPDIVQASDSGLPYIHAYKASEAAQAFQKAIGPILDMS